MAQRAAIIGVGQTKGMTRRKDVGMSDLVFEAAKRALEDAGLTLKDVDAVVFGTAPESFDGINSPDKMVADAVGALNKPFMRIHTGGATGASAAAAGFHQVASGLFDTVLVVGMQRMGQTTDAQKILGLIYDPIFAQGFGLGLVAMFGMRVMSNLGKFGISLQTWEDLAAKQSVSYHNNALNNPYAHMRIKITPEDVKKSKVMAYPARLLHCCPRTDAAAAIVIASEAKAKKFTSTPAWILGSAEETIVSEAGQEGPSGGGVRSCVGRAYKMAGIDKPLQQIDVIENYCPFTAGEYEVYQAFGLCDTVKEALKMAEAGFGEMTGKIPFDPSGGVVCSNPIGATALIRVAEAALQVMGKAEKRQVPDVRVAVSFGAGGNPGPGSATFLASMVLGRAPR